MQDLSLKRTLVATLVCASVANTLVAQDKNFEQPFALVQNQGQWTAEARYQSRHGAQAAWFTAEGWVLDLVGRVNPGVDESDGESRRSGRPRSDPDDFAGVVIAMRFAGASQPRIEPSPRLSARFNFLHGADPDGWREGVTAHEQIRYRSIYKGVDAVVQRGTGLFRYDLHLAAGVDPSRIAIECAGMRSMHLAEDGSLVLRTALGELRQSAPVAWHTQPDGRKLPLVSRFVILDDDRFGFAVDGRQDHLPLVIDPDITWGTFLGGTAWEDAFAIDRGTATGASAIVTICGPTRSTTFPRTTGPVHAGSLDGYVARFDPSKSGSSQLLFSTLFGGSDDDFPCAVEQDLLGRSTVVGITRLVSASSAFPTTSGSFQTTAGGGNFDGFVTQLNPTGGVIYSSFFGGPANDRAVSLKIDTGFNVYVSGYTASATGFPITTGAYQSTHGGGGRDAFVARINAAGSAISYCSYLGGSGTEGWAFNATTPNYYDMATMDLDLEASGLVAVCGRTASSNFPSQNPMQTSYGGAGDMFVSILDLKTPLPIPSAQLVYSTLLGSGATDAAEAVTFESATRIAVAGWTYSTGFPTTANAYNRVHTALNNDAFVLWIDRTKAGSAQLAYSTLLGGNMWDGVGEMEVDRLGVANIGGWCSWGFPTTPGSLIPTIPTTIGRGWFARVAPLASGKADLVYSSYMGDPLGNGASYVAGVALDGVGGVFLCGNTASSRFPTSGGYSSTVAGNRDGWVMHLWALNRGLSVIGRPSPPVCAGNLHLGAEGWPTRGSTNFALSVWGAQPASAAFLGIGLPPQVNIPLCGAALYVSPAIVLGFQSSATGEIRLPVTIPNVAPNITILTQFVLANTGCCLTSTNGLQIKL